MNLPFCISYIMSKNGLFVEFYIFRTFVIGNPFDGFPFKEDFDYVIVVNKQALLIWLGFLIHNLLFCSMSCNECLM